MFYKCSILISVDKSLEVDWCALEFIIGYRQMILNLFFSFHLRTTSDQRESTSVQVTEFYHWQSPCGILTKLYFQNNFFYHKEAQQLRGKLENNDRKQSSNDHETNILIIFHRLTVEGNLYLRSKNWIHWCQHLLRENLEPYNGDQDCHYLGYH